MYRSLVLVSLVVGLARNPMTASAGSVDAHSAGRWQAQPGWTPARLADGHCVAADGEWLKFAVLGRGKQMTWTLVPDARELAGEPRYLLLR